MRFEFPTRWVYTTKNLQSRFGPIVPNCPIRARDTKRVGSEGCGHSVRARRPGLNRARNPSSSIRYVADSSHGIRIDFEGNRARAPGARLDRALGRQSVRRPISHFWLCTEARVNTHVRLRVGLPFWSIIL